MVIQTLSNHARLTAFTALLYWTLSLFRQNLLPIKIVLPLASQYGAIGWTYSATWIKVVGKVALALLTKVTTYQVLHR